MNKWYDDITCSSVYPRGMTLDEFSRNYGFTRIMDNIRNQRISVNVSNGTAVDTFSTLTQGENLPRIMEHLMVDLLHTLSVENPEFISEYVKEHIGRRLQTTAMKQLMDKLEHSDEGVTTVKLEPQYSKLKNKNFNFWWDYDDGEVVVYAESRSIEHDISRLEFDDDEERLEVEQEAEDLIKKLYNDEISIGEFLQSDESTVEVSDLRDGLMAWWNFPEDASDWITTSSTVSGDQLVITDGTSSSNLKFYPFLNKGTYYTTGP